MCFVSSVDGSQNTVFLLTFVKTCAKALGMLKNSYNVRTKNPSLTLSFMVSSLDRMYSSFKKFGHVIKNYLFRRIHCIHWFVI